jgi:hypothetical protein
VVLVDQGKGFDRIWRGTGSSQVEVKTDYMIGVWTIHTCLVKHMLPQMPSPLSLGGMQKTLEKITVESFALGMTAHLA